MYRAWCSPLQSGAEPLRTRKWPSRQPAASWATSPEKSRHFASQTRTTRRRVSWLLTKRRSSRCRSKGKFWWARSAANSPEKSRNHWASPELSTTRPSSSRPASREPTMFSIRICGVHIAASRSRALSWAYSRRPGSPGSGWKASRGSCHSSLRATVARKRPVESSTEATRRTCTAMETRSGSSTPEGKAGAAQARSPSSRTRRRTAHLMRPAASRAAARRRGPGLPPRPAGSRGPSRARGRPRRRGGRTARRDRAPGARAGRC